MANRWGITKDVEKIVRERDTSCVYCGIVFSNDNSSRKNKPSWEHIINDIRINGTNNIAICCMSCNASKGSKLLENWLDSDYCKKKKISINSVSEVVKMALKHPPQLPNP
ncbi:HNH endonuclease [Formosa sp. S-31]|uniref:HNH endonuclease n=1 Tax=Formosa sp. S-31 TaxID=2790949 RepID=UPI003EC0BC64